MDNIDRQLVSALRQNARASVSELALSLRLSRATVRTRIDRLLAEEEILGFTVVLKEDMADMPVRGITLIEIEGKGNERIITRLRGFPEIQAIHSTNGRWDLIVEFGAETLADLDKVLRQMRLIDGINASETNLYLTTHRSNRVVGLFNNKGGDKK
ncbi:Lrp/AsnC family transcriptional regulator [uncultured Sneathiella sp.]|jgi:DNA-binding Lrp family transcriptional regulator|uniref:Lrp/AsnC family transcriptional regulator n=1 Tax=uncultured Sneathiella sp. TaxID=879315 RepID=UPI0030D72422|tara:strand:- start:51323 stop:51790 length:468 start_codon:yes stop_codon:yes gene_type:complete